MDSPGRFVPLIVPIHLAPPYGPTVWFVSYQKTGAFLTRVTHRIYQEGTREVLSRDDPGLSRVATCERLGVQHLLPRPAA